MVMDSEDYSVRFQKDFIAEKILKQWYNKSSKVSEKVSYKLAKVYR